MPYLRIRDDRSDELHEFECDEVRIGRDPELELPISGEGRRVVSGYHVRLFYRDGSWWIADAGSRNGTYRNDERLSVGAAEKLTRGAVFRLGKTGPKYEIEVATKRRLSKTADEDVPSFRPSAPTVRMKEPESQPSVLSEGAAREPHVVFVDQASGKRYDVSGVRIRIGRGRECELRPVRSGDTSISRVHAEIEFESDGTALVRDAGSRNGTLVNGKVIKQEHRLRSGDRIRLGPAGPELVVRQLPAESGGRTPAPQAGERDGRTPTEAQDRPGRSFSGKGATLFFRDLFEESTRRSKLRMRWIVWSFVLLFGAAVAVMYWMGDRQARQTAEQLQQQTRLLAGQQAVADSLMRLAEQEYEQLRQEVERARETATPAPVLDSLRLALEIARERTDALEVALGRAQASLSHQLVLGDSLRREAESELARVREDLDRVREARDPTAVLDSLHEAVRAAEVRAASIEAQIRAVRGLDLASVAQANQSAIGLVTAFFSSGAFDGSGFMLSPSGYFVTNRHLVHDRGSGPDSLYVTMADQRERLPADLVSLAPSGGPDLAVLLVRGYSGPYVRRIDWTGSNLRQGEPAALIGFPAGMITALDASLRVRTSMSAGIFSKVTQEVVQFDGFTVSGSSGSPIFNASGEVVAVHRAGLKQATGLGFGVPIQHLVGLLPPKIKAELGLR